MSDRYSLDEIKEVFFLEGWPPRETCVRFTGSGRTTDDTEISYGGLVQGLRTLREKQYEARVSCGCPACMQAKHT